MNLERDGLFLNGLDVSRETTERLKAYVQLLAKWNKTINLVSKASLAEVWSRHINDSAQIFNFGRNCGHWADLGSGGGLPGIVVAILAADLSPEMQIILVESDQRKSVFLTESVRILGLKAKIIPERVDAIAPLNANVISARALAPLPILCGFAHHHLAQDGTAIFMKGKSSVAEVAKARRDWHFSLETHQSVTDASATILVMKEIRHV